MKNYLLICFLLLTLIATGQECPISILDGYPKLTTPKCDNNNGSIEVVAVGQGQVLYQLDSGEPQTSGLFENLITGTYIITITDESDCVYTFETTLQGERGATINSYDVVDSECTQNTGSIRIHASGGNNIEYSFNGGEFQSNNYFENLAGGSYTIEVRDDNGCIDRRTIEVKQGTIIVRSVDIQNVVCGHTDGSITVNAEGQGALQFRIRDLTDWQSSGVFQNLAAAAYTIDIKDASGCEISNSYRVRTLADYDISKTDADCSQENGQIRVHVSSPGNYKFSIDNGQTYNTTGVFNNLAPGTYRVLVEEENGCQFYRNITINEDVEFEVNHTETPAACNENNGTITASSSTSLTYQLYLGSDLIAENTTGLFTGLAVNEYRLTTTNSLQCSLDFNISIQLDNDVVVEDVITSSSDCVSPTGSVQFIARSLYGNNLEYSINDGAYQSSNEFTQLAAGTYSYKIKSSILCEQEGTFYIQDESDISFTLLRTIPLSTACANDAGIDVIARGVDLVYSLDGINYQSEQQFRNLPAGVYNVYAKSPQGCVKKSGDLLIEANLSIDDVRTTNDTCNASTAQLEIIATGAELTYSVNGTDYFESNLFENLPAGEHTVYIKDKDDCVLSETVTISNNGYAKIDDVTIQHTTCGGSNGQVTIIPDNQGGEYQYSIGENNDYQENPTFTGLAAGEYTVHIKDVQYNCIDSKSIQINTSNELIISDIESNLICSINQGYIQVLVTGGNGTIYYSLNGGAQQTSNQFPVTNEGTYEITVSDDQNCTQSISQEVTIECEALFPTAFGPDGNTKNDIFCILYNKPIQINTFQIFHRDGTLVYETYDFRSDDRSKWWNGEGSATGLYTVHCVFELEDETKVYNGSVQLVR